MKCPNCAVALSPTWGRSTLNVAHWDASVELTEQQGEHWFLQFFKCPECEKIGIYLAKGFGGPGGNMEQHLLWPKRAVTPPLSPHVPGEVATDLREAEIVMADSPKASAALSRRLLQHILAEKGGAAQRDLAEQIDTVLPSLPSYLQTSLDAIRKVGNFAAHPLKSQNAGAIFDVEPGEAEWSLSTLSDLIDFYYVRPQVESERKAELNKKLAEAGKSPMK